MRKSVFASSVALALVLGLVGCGSGTGAPTLGIEPLTEVSGVRVTAENASADQIATAEGAITVGDGELILISPDLTKGALHLTIVSEDGSAKPYDDEASGRVLFTADADPGVYNVEVSGNDATGTMVVCAQSKDELAAQDASLAEALEDAGVEAK
jgi:hypothetical protein